MRRMDLRFPYLGFPQNDPQRNALEGFNNSVESGAEHANDTALRLEPQVRGHHSVLVSASPKGIKRKRDAPSKKPSQGYHPRMGFNDSSGLALVLGPASSSDSRVSSGTSSSGTSCKDNTEDESSMDLDLNIQLQLGSVKNNSPKKHPADLISKSMDKDSALLVLTLSTTESGISCVSAQSDFTLGLGQMRNETEIPINMNNIPLVDEGSTSKSRNPGGYIPTLLMAPRSENTCLGKISKSIASPTIPAMQNESDPSLSRRKVSGPGKSSVSGVSGVTEKQHQQRSNVSTKTCQFQGCGKGARGASGLCIAHGGGRRCQKDGCNKGAEGRTVYCKAHGGGRRCQHLGCTKSAEGKTDFCIGHGGGRRCSNESCDRAARGKSGLCIRHGGGKRCQKEGCTKSAEGYSGLCISHGGGRRCQSVGCTKGAQGSTMHCKAHGGGKRCMRTGCNKGAEGSTPLCKAHGGGKRCLFEGGGICPKSVHGGTKFCVAHGGGKRCAVPECTKSARGRTEFCVRHGGGKRCKCEGCGKSAQGSTDFCKAHGGGKRCQWGVEGSIYAKVQGKNGETLPGPCDRFARGKTGLCAAHSASVQDWRIHGGDTLCPGIGPGLFHGLASTSGTKSQDTSTPNTPSSINLPPFGRSSRSELFLNSASESTISSPAALNIGHNLNNDVNEVDMVECREKKKDSSEGKSQLPTVAFDEMHVDTMGVGNKGYPAYWPPTTHQYLNTINLGGPVAGRSMLGHPIEQHVPVSGLHADLGTSNFPQGSGPAVLQPRLPPQVLVPSFMKNSDQPTPLQMEKRSGVYGSGECNPISLPEGRVHGGGLMAMLTRGYRIGDSGQSSQVYEQHRMSGQRSWI